MAPSVQDFHDRIVALEDSTTRGSPNYRSPQRAVEQMQRAFEVFLGQDHYASVRLHQLVTDAYEDACEYYSDYGVTQKRQGEPSLGRAMDYAVGFVDDLLYGWATDYAAKRREITHGELIEVATHLRGEGTENGLMAATMVAGAVLENHLRALCVSRGCVPTAGRAKEHPSLSDYNQALKSAGVYPTSIWRNVQVWTDIRNAADHHDTKQFDTRLANQFIDELVEFVKAYPEQH